VSDDIESVSKTGCFGPCDYDPSRSATGGTTSDAAAAIELTKQGAWNSDGQLTITADAVLGSTTINVSGTTSLHIGDIMLKVTAPNGNVVAIDQVIPSDNSYSATIGIGGSQYNQDGMYTITAIQSSGSNFKSDQLYQIITVSTEVEVVDGHVIPEFGTIAVMILVVAIVAIIAVSAKTKLSLVPKY